MKHWPRVSIIVLNWNTFEYTKSCLESLRQVTYPNYDVILIDNASSDGSGDRLRLEFPELTFIQNDKNLGFSRGCNVGIKCALARRADYILLLNSDIVVERGFLQSGVTFAEANDRIGLVSGKMYLKDRPGVIWFAGGNVTALRGVSVRGWCQLDEGQFDQPCEVGFATGALMLIKRVVLEEVGLLPEEYFFGQEEWDYSLTVRRAGYKLYYVPDFVAYHKSDGSHRNLDAKYLYNAYRNRLIFHEKFLPSSVFILWKLAYQFYMKFVMKLRLSHLGGETLTAIPHAFKAALRDHHRAEMRRVTEEDLNAFERELTQASAKV